ncbi:MAG: 6-carboxytetrahydropterin synthase [Bacteroidales bacterium]|nr:6-carboxytetrahydropterin synthase [Bacteroidales bacterium]
MMYITRRERFNAAHRLFREEWDDDRNMEVFGKCSNPNWHGHNYTLFVTVKGEVSAENGFVVNLKDLSSIIRSRVIDKVDHKNLNVEVDFIRDKLISTENVAAAIWNELEVPVRSIGAELHCIKLVETENNYVEYYGN